MDKRKAYFGRFDAADGSRWDWEIWAEGAAGAPVELDLSADSPLVIDWEESGTTQALEPSSCKLAAVSPGDRTLAWLYTAKPCAVRLDVRRSGEPYWSGHLDTELYEEPFDEASDYEVSLSFGDFAPLKRLRYDLQGVRTLGEIVEAALDKCGLALAQASPVDLTSTRAWGEPALGAVAVDSANFYDEEGEASTWYDALSGALEPLGVRMRQRAGRVWLYDINALAQMGPRPVSWSGEGQALSVGEIYNRLRITWSTYCKEGDRLGLEPWGGREDIPDPDMIHINRLNPQTYGAGEGLVRFWSYPLENTAWMEGADGAGFTLHVRGHAKGLALGEGAACFAIAKQTGGTEAQGVRVCNPSFYATFNADGPVALQEQANGRASYDLRQECAPTQTHYQGMPDPSRSPKTAPLLSTEPLRVPASAKRRSLRVKVSTDLCIGYGPNPFAKPEDYKTGVDPAWGHAYEAVKTSANIIYVPTRITFVADNGDEYEYCNVGEATTARYPSPTLTNTLGSWEPAGSPYVRSYLAFYKTDVFTGDDGDSTILNSGFVTNRQAVSSSNERLSPVFANACEGQRLPYPPSAGTIKVEVLSRGWTTGKKGFAPPCNYKKKEWQNYTTGLDIFCHDSYGIPHPILWVLLTAPQIEVATDSAYDDGLDGGDVEYDFELNPDAADELQLDHVCGSAASEVSGANGAYLRASDGLQCRAFSRQGREGTCEELLASTIYSQHAAPMARIAGEADLDGGELSPVREPACPGKVFRIAAERQDAYEAVSDIAIIEIKPDEYDKAI